MTHFSPTRCSSCLPSWALGSWLGHLSFRGISLGTAAVFFVGLAFGHFGLTVPKPIMDLGLLLFLYAVGLQAGPRFFRTFRKQGIQFVVIAGIAIGSAAVVTATLAWALKLPLRSPRHVHRRADQHPCAGRRAGRHLPLRPNRRPPSRSAMASRIR